MSHEIESMFFVGQTPWHGLGTRVDHTISISEAIEAAGLNWKVKTQPVFTKIDAGIVGLNGQPVMSEIKAPAQAVIRETDNTVLGVVGERYTPLQNDHAFDFFQPFIDAGEVSLETAGSLSDGKKIWVLARIKDGDVSIKGDDAIRSFLMLSNSHDGTTAVRVGFTPVRIVCANTLAMAVADKGSALMRVKHTASIRSNLDLIRNTVNVARRQFEASAEQYRRLANTDINQRDVLTFVQKFFDIEGKQMDEISTRTQNQINTVLQLSEFGRGSDLTKGMTLWKLYNGVTEFLTHEVSDNADKRYNSLWFGGNADKNKKALEILLAMAA